MAAWVLAAEEATVVAAAAGTEAVVATKEAACQMLLSAGLDVPEPNQ